MGRVIGQASIGWSLRSAISSVVVYAFGSHRHTPISRTGAVHPVRSPWTGSETPTGNRRVGIRPSRAEGPRTALGPSRATDGEAGRAPSAQVRERRARGPSRSGGDGGQHCRSTPFSCSVNRRAAPFRRTAQCGQRRRILHVGTRTGWRFISAIRNGQLVTHRIRFRLARSSDGTGWRAS